MDAERLADRITSADDLRRKLREADFDGNLVHDVADEAIEAVERVAAERDAAVAEVRRLRSALTTEADNLRAEVDEAPSREPDYLDDMLGIDPSDTAQKLASRAVQYRHLRAVAVARADAAEAQTREWRHKYDVLLREHDAATTELAEAAAAVDRVRDQIWSFDDSDEVQAGVIFRALDGGTT